MTQPSSLQNENDFILFFEDAEPAPEITTDEEALEALDQPEGEGLSESDITALLNSLVAAGDMHTGAMIALRPSVDDIERIAADSHEPAEELHCTILYLGESMLIDADAQDRIIGVVSKFTEMKPIKANGFSVAVFNPEGDESCLVLQVGDSVEVQSIRDLMFKQIAQIMGDSLPKQYVPYTPHVTLSYDADASLIPRLTHLTGPITFDAIRIAFGDDVIDIEFENEDEDD